MLRESSLAILALIGSILVLTGCGDSVNVNSPGNANVPAAGSTNSSPSEPGMDGVKDGAEELEALIKLPFQPEDLVWKEFLAGSTLNVQGRRLLVVFQLTPQDAKSLIERSAKAGAGSPAVISVEKWFPAELITQSELSSDEGIAVTSYPANEFIQDPFKEGTLSHVDETDFFVLDLFAR